jgi:eukaryotic-like serine/threonine-protein kinase
MHISTVILIVLATSMGTTVGTVYVMERYNIVPHRPPPVVDTVVPELKGLIEADARSSASAANLMLLVAAQEATADAKPNTVLRQSLAAAQRVPLKSPISVVLAQELPKVPVLVGLIVDAATQRLRASGYTIQVAGSVADAKVPVGQVARQMPAADTAYVKGAAVTVQISSGPADVEIPKFLRRPYLEATKEVEALGLKATVGWISEGETPEYIVLQQAPTAGKKVAPGSEVHFIVNR